MAANQTVGANAQRKIIAYVQSIMSARSLQTEMRNKMQAIDIAYARYTASKELEQGLDATGRDVAGKECCGNIFGEDNITAPIVVSQVDSMVAYLSDVFLSGYPLFPVVSSPLNKKYAEQLETLLDDHAQLGGYVRQLLMFIRDGVKYNVSAIEADWDSINQFSVLADYTDDSGRKVKSTTKSITKIKRLDMYNTFWDTAVNPGDVALEGDFAGYIEILSKTKLKRLCNKLARDEKSINIKESMESWAKMGGSPVTSHYQLHPTVSEYITPRSGGADFNWDTYLGMQTAAAMKNTSANLNDGSSYEKVVVYARILPVDFEITAPNPKTPQIWKFTVINNAVVLSAERIVSAYDALPILFGQPLEDGLGYQTQSVAEGTIPFQEAASTLFNIRFAAARRAVSDRALYDPDLINPSDVNSPHPAAKIPVRMKVLSNKNLEQAYKSIPFDMRGTETTLSDARTIVNFSQDLSGINGPQQGQFQKGNKSVTEWTDTIGNSNNRLRLPAMVLEGQVFTPLKQMLALNIFQYGENAVVVSQKTGQSYTIDIDKLREQVLSFRISDGYTPKSKMASVDMLNTGLQLISSSPILQQAYGTFLPDMFAHLMDLGGVRNLEQYSPQAIAQNQQLQQNSGLQDQTLQAQTQNQQQPTLPGGSAIPPAQSAQNPAVASQPAVGA